MHFTGCLFYFKFFSFFFYSEFGVRWFGVHNRATRRSFVQESMESFSFIKFNSAGITLGSFPPISLFIVFCILFGRLLYIILTFYQIKNFLNLKIVSHFNIDTFPSSSSSSTFLDFFFSSQSIIFQFPTNEKKRKHFETKRRVQTIHRSNTCIKMNWQFGYWLNPFGIFGEWYVFIMFWRY